MTEQEARNLLYDLWENGEIPNNFDENHSDYEKAVKFTMKHGDLDFEKFYENISIIKFGIWQVETDALVGKGHDLTSPNGFEEYSQNCEALKLAQDNLWTLAEDLVDNLAINESALQDESTGILVADNCIRRAYNICAFMLLKRYDLLIKRAADSEPGSPNETFFKRSALGILKLTYGFT